MTATEQLRRSPVSTSPEQRLLGWGLIGLASLLVVNTLAGPLVLGWLDYELDETLTNQLLGLELVTILLVVPWAGLAGAMALRGHPLAALLGFAPAAYSAYMFVQYLLGPEYDRLGPAPLFHLLITSLAGGLALASWSQARPRPVPLDLARDRVRALVLVGLAAFVLLRYVGLLVGAFREEPLAGEYRESVTFYWSIVLLDLGVVVPATLAAAIALWHRRDVGGRAFVAVLGWFALVPPSVAAMAAVMFVRDDPNASVATVALLGVASLVFAGYAAVVHRTLFQVLRDERRVNHGVSTSRSSRTTHVRTSERRGR